VIRIAKRVRARVDLCGTFVEPLEEMLTDRSNRSTLSKANKSVNSKNSRNSHDSRVSRRSQDAYKMVATQTMQLSLPDESQRYNRQVRSGSNDYTHNATMSSSLHKESTLSSNFVLPASGSLEFPLQDSLISDH
jgi:hypothetical protein